MSRLRPLHATTLTILLAASLGSPPVSASASAHPRARSVLTPKRHQHASERTHRTHRANRTHQARKVHQLQPRARSRTRGFRGVTPAATHNASRPTAASSRASAIAAALAASCQNTELTPTPSNLDAIRTAVLCLVNKRRAQDGEAPLVLNQQLERAAEGHSQEMVAGDYFQHVSPSGVTPVDRIRAGGYIPSSNVGYVIGENLAWGTIGLATPQAIVNAWIASPGHLANILEAQYTETGIGITPQVPASLSGGSPGATYTQEFGVIIH